MDPVDLDALAAEAGRILELDRERADEVIVTLAEHHDRRVVAPLIDLLASGRADELMVRAAGWLADPALHDALTRLAATRVGEGGDPGYWEQVDRAIGRCRPEAPIEAEEVEVALLTATQVSVVEAGLVALEVELIGAYPTTEVVLRQGDHEARHPVWNFDEANPDDPTTLDRPFTLYRIAQLAAWG